MVIFKKIRNGWVFVWCETWTGICEDIKSSQSRFNSKTIARICWMAAFKATSRALLPVFRLQLFSTASSTGQNSGIIPVLMILRTLEGQYSWTAPALPRQNFLENTDLQIYQVSCLLALDNLHFSCQSIPHKSKIIQFKRSDKPSRDSTMEWIQSTNSTQNLGYDRRSKISPDLNQALFLDYSWKWQS